MALRVGRSRIPELLARIGKSQVQLADHLGVSEGFISAVIAGKKKLSYERSRNAAIFLKCHMEELTEWDEKE